MRTVDFHLRFRGIHGNVRDLSPLFAHPTDRLIGIQTSVDLVTAQLDTPTTFSYRMTIKNDGTGPAVVVRFQNLLPPHFSFVPGSTGGNLTPSHPTIRAGPEVCGAAPEELTWSSFASREIGPQEVRTLTFQARATLANGTYYSQTLLRYIPSWQKSHVFLESPYDAEVTVGTGAPRCSYAEES